MTQQQKNLVILAGSTRIKGSTSDSIGAFFESEMKKHGWATRRFSLARCVRKNQLMNEMLEKLGQADLIALSVPVYYDSFPALVIEILEALVEKPPFQEHASFLVISNCGLPESLHNDVVIAQSQLFAEQVGLQFAGSLAISEGGAIAGKPLEDIGFLTRNIRRGLTIAAQSLSKGQKIPKNAARLAAKPALPPWIFRKIANRLLSKETKRKKLNAKARPYEEITAGHLG